MARVDVSRPYVGICHMQACAVKDASDAEILAVCNRENPSGTSLGWTTVIREGAKQQEPVACEQAPERLHFLVSC